MKRVPTTRKGIMLDALLYGVVITVLSFIIPFKQDFFDHFGGREYFIIWSVAAYAFGLMTLKIIRDWKHGRK